MKDTFYNIQEQNKAAWLRADIDPKTKAAAKRLAKMRGMTLQGWLAQLIIRELAASDEERLNRIWASDSLTGHQQGATHDNQ